jgi:hypothetical protein
VSPEKMLRETIGLQPFSPNLEPLKTIVTYGNLIHPPFHPPIHSPGLPVQVTCYPGPQTLTFSSPQNNGRPTNQGLPVQVNEFLMLRKPEQNKNKLETRSGFASELEIENIDDETQNLDFDPKKIEVTQQMSEEDLKVEIALVTAPKTMTLSAETGTSPKSEIKKLIDKLIGGETAPKVMTSSDKAMTSSGVHRDETLKEIDLQLFYKFDFSQRS